MRRLTIISLLFLAVTLSVQAVTISTNVPGVPATETSACKTVYGFYNFALMIGGILAFCSIVYGGVKYTLAAGNPGGQSEGKEWIKSAILGLLLLVSAYIILNIINPDIVKCQLPQLGGIGGQNISSGGGDNSCTPPCVSPAMCSTGSCILPSGTVVCSGARNGFCPIVGGVQQVCTDRCGFPNSCYQCVTPIVVNTCGGAPPNSHFGSCQPVAPGSGLCNSCVNIGGATPDTARYSCTGSPQPC